MLGCCTVSGMVLGRISRLVLLFTEMLRLASGIDRVTAGSYLFIMLSDGGWTVANLVASVVESVVGAMSESWSVRCVLVRLSDLRVWNAALTGRPS